MSSAGGSENTRLFGRDRECTARLRPPDEARARRSGVLVVRGEAGAGRTSDLHALRRERADRFLTGLAVLTLLADTADEQNLHCLVDDVQWLDRASLEVLTFAARRLVTEPIAVVLAMREGADDHHLTDLPTLTVSPLGDDDARRVLLSTVRGRLDEHWRAWRSHEDRYSARQRAQRGQIRRNSPDWHTSVPGPGHPALSVTSRVPLVIFGGKCVRS